MASVAANDMLGFAMLREVSTNIQSTPPIDIRLPCPWYFPRRLEGPLSNGGWRRMASLETAGRILPRNDVRFAEPE